MVRWRRWKRKIHDLCCHWNSLCPRSTYFPGVK